MPALGNLSFTRPFQGFVRRLPVAIEFFALADRSQGKRTLPWLQASIDQAPCLAYAKDLECIDNLVRWTLWQIVERVDWLFDLIRAYKEKRHL